MRRVQFTIRDLLWFTVLAALITAWWLDHNSLVAAWWLDHNSLVDRNRFTVETWSDGEPVLLRDNVTHDVLVKDKGYWRVGRVLNDSPATSK
jgi:hypothetical protein